MKRFRDSIRNLIIETATNLPEDVRRVLAKNSEHEHSTAAQGLELIKENVDLSYQKRGAICQDTGMLTFEVFCPQGLNQMQIISDIREAVSEATSLGKLRPNSVDSITGDNSKNNLSPSTPVIHFTPWEHKHITAQLILKGGGCENQNSQYSLPCQLQHLGMAERDLNGVKKCILHSIWKAQGHGCAPGFLGVAIGGDRATGYSFAKEQLFRSLDDKNPVPELNQLENEVILEANKLNVGVMGFGGKLTVLGCKIGAYHRVPASFFVSVSYNCWALRRLGIDVDVDSGEILTWHHKFDSGDDLATTKILPIPDNAIILKTPLSEDSVRHLKVGDVVLLSGKLFTARDAVHKYLSNHDCPNSLTNQVIYHCGPVMLKDSTGRWTVQAAGPTTSSREEPYQAKLIEKFGIRAVIGKGGMGPKTLEAFQKFGAVYLHAIGGAAQVYAKTMKKVLGVSFLDEFGIPEALWEIECENLPAIVTMDAHGHSLHQDVEIMSANKLTQCT